MDFNTTDSSMHSQTYVDYVVKKNREGVRYYLKWSYACLITEE